MNIINKAPSWARPILQSLANNGDNESVVNSPLSRIEDRAKEIEFDSLRCAILDESDGLDWAPGIPNVMRTPEEEFIFTGDQFGSPFESIKIFRTDYLTPRVTYLKRIDGPGSEEQPKMEFYELEQNSAGIVVDGAVFWDGPDGKDGYTRRGFITE